MPALAAQARLIDPQFATAVPAPERPLALLDGELSAICARVALLQASARPAVGAWRDTLQQLKVHLFLTASQLLPLWRDLCRDTRPVDSAEFRLARLDALTDEALRTGADDPMTQARHAVLAEDLRQHHDRYSAVLRALETVVEDDSLLLLTDLWGHESERLRHAQRQGLPLRMDNEDADPVGQPPR